MRLEIGSRLGPYEVTGWIGAGGMGEVYRARDTRLGREVAVKVLPENVIRDADRVSRFQREACSASALNHRNIVTVHDFTCSDHEAWLVMELISGESLRGTLARGPLPLKRLISIGSGIADGLAAAHAASIVHRDLKPENVMVASDGTPKILDFGLVKQTAPFGDPNSPTDAMVSSAGVIMGTAAYMSPEQARGEPVDFQTDQFSFGLMLHEMATGRHPFARPTGVATLAAILNEEPAGLDDKVPARLAEIIERCLSKQSHDRYASTADLAHDLRSLGTRADRSTEPLPQRLIARPWWPAAVASLLLIGALGAALFALMRRPVSRQEAYQLSVATPEIAEVSRDEVGLPVALSPDGHYLVIYGLDRNGVPALWLHDLRSGSARLLAQHAFSVGWSPDSKSIAYFADDKLKTVSVAGGPARIVCDARPDGIPSWQGDSILFNQFSVRDQGVYRVDAGGGNPERVARADPSRPASVPFWPQYLPDGKHYLYLLLLLRGTEIDHELYAGSFDGQPAKKISASIDSRVIYADGKLLFVRDGTLLAQPFDADRVRFTGEAKPVVSDLHYFRSTGLAAVSVSDNGVLAWRDPIRESRLVWMDRAGFELKEVGVAAFQPDGRISPDGRRYAVGVADPKQGVSDLWIYDLERDSAERVTFRALDEKEPVWAADGQSLFYRSDGHGTPDILQWTPGADAGTALYAGPAVEQPRDVSPDGKTMLFERLAAGGDLYLLPLNPKGEPRPWLVTPFNETSPRFSPDGRWVAYQSDFSGRPEVYVRALEGAATSSRISRNGGTLPRWRRDGKELFYLAPGGRIMSSAMQNGTGTDVPRILFQAAEAIDFEPSNDGTRFLTQLAQRTTEPPVHLLINWPARLRSEN
jgi:Tol biopolymer transport system component